MSVLRSGPSPPFTNEYSSSSSGVVGTAASMSEPVNIVLGGRGASEHGVERIHVVYVAVRSARFQRYVAFDQRREILAPVAVQVVIAEQHRDRRGAASVHVFRLRHGVREKHVAGFVRNGGAVDRHGQGPVRQVQRESAVSGIDGLPDRERTERISVCVLHCDRAAEPCRAVGELVRAGRLRSGNRKRAGRSALDQRQIVYQRGSFGGNPCQIEVEDRALVRGNGSSVCNGHGTGQDAAGRHLNPAAGTDKRILRNAAGTDCHPSAFAERGAGQPASAGNPDHAI